MSKTLKRLVAVSALAAVVITPAAALAGGKAEKKAARMTGGGWVYGKSMGETVKVTHGFELHCRTATTPQRLQVNWSGGNAFHLTTLTKSYCDDEGYDQENPDAPIDTYYGEGTGRLNTDRGETYTAKWRFVDNGERGSGADRIRIEIRDEDGDLVLNVVDKVLHNGNHQAHRSTGSKA